MAQRKDPIKTNYIPDSNKNSGLAFVTFNPENSDEAENALQNSKALESYQAVTHHTAYAYGGRDRYADIDTNISVRNEFTRNDYDAFRPSESRNTVTKVNMARCDKAYKRVGIVRNVIDLMADFGCQGIKLIHENKRIERFSQRWFKHMVDGPKTTERFLNYLYRIGTVVCQRQTCKITLSEERRMAIASEYDIIEPSHEMKKPLRIRKKVIPCGYTFLNPMTLEVAGGELAQFAGDYAYGLKITGSLRTKISSPKNEMEKRLIEKLPTELVEAVKNGIPLIPLDRNKICAYSYKKDDWDTWASPMLECILDDLTLLEKMKLADLAALDGAISQIRVWRLGDLDKGILPTDAAIQKLADILLSNPGGGAFDLIWGPELSFEEVTTSVHNFLGGTKYEPILDSIYSGLGVPPSLTGSSRAVGATNNFISLQTLIQRLEYGRQQVTKFWEQELELLTQAMGWSKAPKVQFDNMILKDEAAEKALLIQLLDRNLISEEMVIEMFGAVPEIELSRKRKEARERVSGKRPTKTGPYDRDKVHELVKIALSKGLISPDDVGIETEDDDVVDSNPNKSLPAPDRTSENPSGGRPQNSKDDPSINRDRSFKPRTSADIANELSSFLTNMNWVRNAQSVISGAVSPGILKHYNKKNMRSLSWKEAIEAEEVKFRILCNLEKIEKVDEETIQKAVSSGCKTPQKFKNCYNALISAYKAKSGKQPTVEEIRNIQAATYCVCSAKNGKV